ncbi:MAG: xanthine dehydrogenase accessory factor [Pseudorhodobacter sp.]|jgi:xanthine dehydrogenase accessory factor
MFDLAGMRHALAAHGPVARVVIAAHDGSSPREVGAAMLVWATGQSGTVGGGALEWEALARARKMLDAAAPQMRLDREPLGPKLGQCCGGAVTLLTEIYTAGHLATLDGDVIARSVTGAPMPLAVKRLLAQARGQGLRPNAVVLQGWMVEPVARPNRQVWVWGAGHVGRALVAVLAPLPDVAITWVDVDTRRFPVDIPAGVTMLPAADPGLLVVHAPLSAEHLILTYSHMLDLDLCHRLLQRGFARCGLIGSRTKWARFRSRLAALGHSPLEIGKIDCPIGEPALGKHPQSIAIGVAMAMLHPRPKASRQESTV